MELAKKKYKKAEVDKIVDDISFDYEQKIKEQQSAISYLEGENQNLIAELCELKSKEGIVSKTLESAQKRADEVNEKALVKYRLEIERLKRFVEKFNAYFDYLQEKYPYYPAVKEAEDIFKKISSITNGAVNMKAIDKLDAVIPEVEIKDTKPFNPKDKIKDYIMATSDNGFSMEEVLNPGQLELEDLCKELGLMEDEN